jgi:hypothetical protein
VAIADLAQARPIALGRLQAPPAFCTGSAISIATVSAPSCAITDSISLRSARVSAAPCSSRRNALVLATCRVSTAGRPNGSLNPGTPVNESAPSVTPW